MVSPILTSSFYARPWHVSFYTSTMQTIWLIRPSSMHSSPLIKLLLHTRYIYITRCPSILSHFPVYNFESSLFTSIAVKLLWFRGWVNLHLLNESKCYIHYYRFLSDSLSRVHSSPHFCSFSCHIWRGGISSGLAQSSPTITFSLCRLLYTTTFFISFYFITIGCD